MKNLKKTMLVYLGLAAFAYLFDRVYSLFSHGVGSAAMASMCLWLLGLGTIVYGLLYWTAGGMEERQGYRLFYNLYNSGIAVLVTGRLLQGILEIAGSSSSHLVWYSRIAWILTAVGSIGLLATAISFIREQPRGSDPSSSASLHK